MGKWIARLKAESMQRPSAGADETHNTRPQSDALGLSGVLSVSAPGASANSSCVEPDLSAVAWTDPDVGRFLDFRARLLRWGWPEVDAERVAERLVMRDRARDTRTSCTECAAYRPGRCVDHRRAGLFGPEVGRDFAVMLQRCPGFEEART